jgi:hypothetical protein
MVSLKISNVPHKILLCMFATVDNVCTKYIPVHVGREISICNFAHEAGPAAKPTRMVNLWLSEVPQVICEGGTANAHHLGHGKLVFGREVHGLMRRNITFNGLHIPHWR